MAKLFYIEENNQIIGYDPKKERLERILKMPEYSHLEIKETERPIENYRFADTEDYIGEQARKEKETRNIELQKQIDALELKRTRAIAEPGIKDEATGQSWLEYRTEQIKELREQMNN